MRIVTPDEKNGIYLGRQGENLATQVQFDVNVAGWVETYGVGIWELLNRRPSDPAGYPVEISVEDNIIKWDLTATDLKYAGCGTCELVYYVDEVIAKSIIYGTQILPAIDGTGEIPEPWESWIDEVEQARDDAQAAAEAAAGSASSAEGFAQDASASAAEASDSAYAAGQSADAAEDSADTAKDEADRAAELADQIEHSIDDIEALIPPQASPENQLADKNFVNSSISTNTANYISNNGQPFTSVEQLEAYSGPVSNNDYAFVTGTDSAGNTFYDRYKATVSEGVVSWAFEYRLNNSSFTAAQWAAIESGITSSQVADYNAHLANQNNPHSVTKEQIGLGNVDNTPDAQKPVSQAQAAALALKADKVVDAVAGDFAALDANGNLTDSGISKEISEQLEGELVNFKAAYAVPLKALSVALSPIQDLHGYDSPWPAGGGKNKLEVEATTATDHDVVFTVNADGTITANGTAGGTAIFEVNHSFASDAEYILSGCPSGGGSSTYELQQNTSPILRDYGSGVTIPSGKTGSINIVIRSGVQVNNLVFKPMIRLSSVADATFAPYANICPISGRTEVNVTRSGKNLINPSDFVQRSGYSNLSTSFSGGVISITGYEEGGRFCGFVFPQKVGEKYTISRTSTSGLSGIRLSEHDEKPTKASIYTGTTLNLTTPYTYTATKPWAQLQVEMSANATITDLQVESGENKTTYAAPNFTTETISLGGTVYGGTVDVTGGNGTDVMGEVVDLSALTWSIHTYGKQSSSIDSLIRHNYGLDDIPNIFAEQYKPVSLNTFVSASRPANAITVGSDGRLLITTNDTPSGQLVYEKATPSALSTTPTEIDTLAGDNNVWADAGPITLERWKGLGEIIAAVHEALSA